MKVYTFYQQMFDNENPLINYWKKSWQDAGWEPEVLNLSHAKADKEYAPFVKATRELPTVNTINFEEMCYVRWLALKHVGGGLLTDYDVINYSLPPTEPNSDLEICGHIWGCVWTTEQGVIDLLTEICQNGKSYIVEVNGRPHVSDARIGHKFPKTKKRYDIRHYMAQDIQDGKNKVVKPLLVHYSNNWWRQRFNVGTKVKSIQEFEKKYGLQPNSSRSGT